MRNMNYKPIALGSITELSNEEWLKWREHGPLHDDPSDPRYIKTAIGGSDVAKILNVSPWETNIEFWYKKTSKPVALSRPMNQAALEGGHLFEPFVGQRFYQKMVKDGYRIEMIPDFTMYRSGEILLDDDGLPVVDMETGTNVLRYPFALADLDERGRIYIDGKWHPFIAEYKTTSAMKFDNIQHWKDGIVPIYYEYQCRWYMAVTNIDICFICCCWGFREDECAIIRIDRDLEIEEEMLEEVKSFVACVESETEPDISSCKADLFNNFYLRLYGERDSYKYVELDPDQYAGIFMKAKKLDEKIQAAEKTTAELKAQREEIYKELFTVYGDCAVGKCKIGDEICTLTLKPSMTRGGLDIEKMIAENPALFNKYANSVNSTLLKKENPEEYKKYYIPPKMKPEGGGTFVFKSKMDDAS